jgi:hypothetical protein
MPNEVSRPVINQMTDIDDLLREVFDDMNANEFKKLS